VNPRAAASSSSSRRRENRGWKRSFTASPAGMDSYPLEVLSGWDRRSPASLNSVEALRFVPLDVARSSRLHPDSTAFTSSWLYNYSIRLTRIQTGWWCPVGDCSQARRQLKTLTRRRLRVATSPVPELLTQIVSLGIRAYPGYDNLISHDPAPPHKDGHNRARRDIANEAKRSPQRSMSSRIRICWHP
jgi:hypothetical protein